MMRQHNKVAEVNLYFWIMKILATTLGETAGDYLSMSLGLGYYTSFAITFSILAIILWLQISILRQYHPAVYWAAIVGTTTAGTEVSDLMDRSFGLGYAKGSFILVTGLLVTFGIWYFRERNLNYYPIVRKDIELMYWLCIIFSNSLGTAFGDYLTTNLGLSYLSGAMLTAAIIGVIMALHYFTQVNDIVLFWLAFILTRPFGATFGDFLTKPLTQGGLSLSRSIASLVTLGLLGILLIVSTRYRRRKHSQRDFSQPQALEEHEDQE
ncbi:membrane protein with DUF347 repeats [Thermosynechococcus sp. NK55a]|nr:membrane protein with DUF347 repeats [Thermosynechococcus sp. NK55a]